MRLLLLKLFFSSFLASVVNQSGELTLDKNSSAHKKELVILKNKVILNRRSPENKGISFRSEFDGFFNLNTLMDFPKLFTDTPPKKLKEPRNFKHGTFAEVHEHLKHSLLSFCPAEGTLGYKCVCRKNYKYISKHENTEIDSFSVVAVHRTKKTIYISYRPSMKPKNWISAINYEMTQFPGAPDGALAHRGLLNYFMTTHNSTLAEVKKLLIKPELSGYDLLISGISLGSGVTTIALPFWQDVLDSLNDKRKIKAFIYSGPRVGNELFAQYIESLNIPITRYTNGNDIIPHLPPRSFGYVHVGAEIHEVNNGFHAKAQLKLCRQDYDEDPDCAYKEWNPVSVARHSLVFGKVFPLPPYC